MPSAADFLGDPAPAKKASADDFLNAPAPAPKPLRTQTAGDFLGTPPAHPKISATDFLKPVKEGAQYVGGKIKDSFNQGLTDVKQGFQDMGARPTLDKGLGGYVAGEAKALAAPFKMAGGVAGMVFSPLQGASDAVQEKTAAPARQLPNGKMTPGAPGIDLMSASMLAGGPKAVEGLGAAAKGLREGPLGAMAGSVQKTFAPATVSERSRAVSTFIRGAGARSQLQVEKTSKNLLALDQRLQRGTPEQNKAFIDFLENRSKDPGDKGAFVSHPGVKSAFTMSPSDVAAAKKFGLTSEDVAAANEIRSAYKSYQDRAEYLIKRNTGSAPKFIEDYYTHMWMEDPKTVEQKMSGFFKQGSGRNFKQRSIPTIADGIEAGLTPRYTNPIEATIVYSQNMSNLLTTHDVQGFMKTNGHANWFRPGQQPEGWVPLQGILTERKPKMSGRTGSPKGETGWEPAPGRIGGPGNKALPPGGEGPKSLGRPELNTIEDPKRLGGPEKAPSATEFLNGEARPQIEGPSMRNITPEAEAEAKAKAPAGDRAADKEILYAPEDAARIYNNWISKGFETNTSVGHGYETVRKLTNGATALKLSMSAFHGMVMAQEAAISSVARGFNAGLRGDVKGFAGGLARAPTALVTSGFRGRRMGQQLLGLKEEGPIAQKINKAFIDSGGRIRMDKLYRTTDGRSFYDAIKSKTFNKEVANAWERIAGKDKSLTDRGRAIVSTGANVVQSIFQGPLFEDIIPAVKRGAFAERMEDFLKANPGASDDEITRFAVKLQDSVDNRFGELVQDNLFWHKQMKQTSQILLTSPTWDIGTVREVGGGLTDLLGPSVKGLVKGQGVTDRTAYVAALVAVVATENAMLTAMKTGKPPTSVQDLAAYRTGGTDNRLGEAPERGMIPGYQKDVYAFADAVSPGSNGILGMARNKLSPGAAFVADMVTNEDYSGKKIYGPAAREGALTDEMIDALMPISVGAFARGQPKGSNLSPLERAAAIRQAPINITNPEALDRIRANKAEREKKSAEKSYRRREERYEP